jgi:hypothetical protein
VVQRIAIRAKKLQIRGPIISVHSNLVIQNRFEGLAIPYKRFCVKATLRVVTSLRKRWVLLLAPVVVVLSDNLAPSLAISVAKYVTARQFPF